MVSGLVLGVVTLVTYLNEGKFVSSYHDPAAHQTAEAKRTVPYHSGLVRDVDGGSRRHITAPG
jgi:hypothetical protein